MFLQLNGLTRRVILEPDAQPDKQTEVWTSDLTDEGKKLVESAHMKWLQARAGGADPEDMSLFSAALAKLRGQAQKASISTRTLAGKGKKPGKAFSSSAQKRAGKGAKLRAANNGGDSMPPFKWNKELEKEWEESGPHVYDKAKWHYEGDYPEGLPTEQAFVHTGMFIGWIIDHDMIEEDFLPEAEQFKRRAITGAGAYEIWDGVLADDMLTEEGNQFARDYYGEAFAEDYTKVLVGKLPSFYHVKDTWKNYQALKARIDERYRAWKAKSPPGRK